MPNAPNVPNVNVQANHFDVLIIGAGLSGVGAAYHLQTRSPNKTFAILEARDAIGGTWDLFRYPGVRSDSDMHTLGYSFRPWSSPKSIADGPSILAYVRETAAHYGIDKKIRFHKKVERASWSSRDARWTVSVRDAKSGNVEEYTAGFLFVCAGYYDYDEGYTPEFPGIEKFRGRVVHPQKWTDDVDYANKRVVVIGSGATAMTLVPELAKRAASVTMLQRSPTYVVSAPESDPVANWLREKISPDSAHAITRWKNVMIAIALYQYCQRFPERAKRLLIGQVRKAVGSKVDVEKHFTPKYNPWDQRLCLVPEGDLFRALRDGRAHVVTDTIDTITETGIRLKSGEEIPADLIVTATGLKLKFLGGMIPEVDGKRVDPAQTVAYKGVMFSGVPNLAVAIGYTNASWTLKCDLISEHVCRLLNHMDAKGFAWCMPRADAVTGAGVPLLDLTSGYVQRGADKLPRQGATDPWRVHQNYLRDLRVLRHAPVDDPALEFHRASPIKPTFDRDQTSV